MSNLAVDGSGNAIQALRPTTSKVVAYTTTTASTAYTQDAVIRVTPTTDCFITIEESATATTSDMYMPANTVEYFTVKNGMSVAAVQLATGGNLNITIME